MAKKYLSAKRLKITELEREYLIKVRKTLYHMKPKGTTRVDGLKMGFDMTWIILHDPEHNTKSLCGAAGCIKGWMAAMMIADNKVPDVMDAVDLKKSIKFGWTEALTCMDESRALRKLFYPSNRECNMGNVTPFIAAKAIGQFLSGKKKLDWGAATYGR